VARDRANGIEPGENAEKIVSLELPVAGGAAVLEKIPDLGWVVKTVLGPDMTADEDALTLVNEEVRSYTSTNVKGDRA
jgi:hypothetical protein